MSRAGSATANTPATTARSATTPTSSPTRCRCSADAVKAAAVAVAVAPTNAARVRSARNPPRASSRRRRARLRRWTTSPTTTFRSDPATGRHRVQDTSVPTWLVTGGAGFIGGNFVIEAVARGVRVINLDALTYAGNLDTLASLDGSPGHLFVHGDIGDRALVVGLLAEHRPDAVLNFAAETHVVRSSDGPAAFIQTSVVGTLALLQAARDYWASLDGGARARFRFLHVSTDEVYGSLGETGRFTESTPYAPNSPYSASKAASDHLVRAFHHTYGLPTLTTHCS